MNTFFGLDFGRTISTQQYIESIENETARNMVSNVINESINGLIHTIKRAKPREPIPEVVIRVSQDVFAESIDGLIKISSGLIDYCMTVCVPCFTDICPENEQLAKIDLSYMPSAIMIWILTHEYFHSARSHGDSMEREGNDNLTQQTMEFDADLCAAAALFRVLQVRYRLEITDINMRILALFYLFWPIRTLPCPTSQTTHPNTAERLWYIVLKLAIVTESSRNDAIVDKDMTLQDTRDKGESLVKSLIAFEVQYMKSIGAKNVKTGLLADLINAFDSGSTSKLILRWEEVRGTVASISGLTA